SLPKTILNLHPDLIANPVGLQNKRGSNSTQNRYICNVSTASHHQQRDYQNSNQPAIHEHAGSKKTRLAPRKTVLTGIANQVWCLLHLGHDGIACVDTLPARDALKLKPFANIDTRRTSHDTSSTVDAVAITLSRFTFMARLSPAFLIADDQGVLVQEGGLQARIGARHGAHLLTKISKIEKDQKGSDTHHQKASWVRKGRRRHPLQQDLNADKVGQEDIGNENAEHQKHKVLEDRKSVV